MLIHTASTITQRFRWQFLYLNLMKSMTRLFTLLIACIFYVPETKAQVAKTQVVQLTATANADGTITIKWPKETYSGNFKVYHRNFSHNNNVWSSPDAKIGRAHV